MNRSSPSSLTRRALLQATAMGLLWGAVPRALRAQSVPVPLAILLTELPEGLGEQALETLLRPFLEGLVPVGLVLPQDDPPKARAIHALSRRYPGLVEAVLALPPETPLGTGSFDLARAGSDAALAMQTALAEPDIFRPLTAVAPAGPVPEPSPAGLRTVGLRSVFVLEGEGAAISWSADHVEWLRGSVTLSMEETGTGWVRAVETAVGDQPLVVVNLSLRTDDTAGAMSRAADLADRLSALRVAGGIRSLLPKEIFLRRAGADYRQSCLLLLERPAVDDPAVTAFAGELARAGLGHGWLEAGTPVEPAPFACRPAGVQVVARCVLSEGPLPDAARATVAIWSDLLSLPRVGFDAGGMLNLPVTVELSDVTTRGGLRTRFGATGDVFSDQVVLVRPGAIRQDSARRVLLTALTQMRDTDLVRFTGLADHLEAIYPNIWIADRRQAVDRFRAGLRPSDEGLPALARDRVMEDARRAWRYFTYEQSAVTGLSASTRFTSDEYSTSNPEITMWDVASTIHAVMSAMELGLLAPETGTERLARIVAALPTRELSGLALPAALMRHRTLGSTNRDFNGCDMGRLLVALKRAAGIPALTAQVGETVARWDLAATLDAAGPIDIRTGRTLPGETNHCTAYALAGYRLWLSDDPAEGDRITDVAAAMRFFQSDTMLTPLGAEPYMLRALELGASDGAALGMDALLSAETEAFETTGVFHALSETPLDRAPWFSYQGLDPRARPPGFAATFLPDDTGAPAGDAARDMVLSAKAAYLGAALRPTPFTLARLDHMRRTCAVGEAGFIVGTYARSSTPMTGYTDVNTNGIILEAASYLLTGRAPLVGG
ncbi:DUF3131 domain-containing protein [Maritimibacter sp. DP07]|uniref:DUF3131 domain-containing protein n=1 Tax=Maritimibacter harenae TaxID=2606218 RepID=A0A845LWC1_9RHOB|nr:DUF3131 domain-containing protein [Maritimibacter harenae]MZR11646.1 DUF3131 domain-containing protein [Maritimibacter harenae]